MAEGIERLRGTRSISDPDNMHVTSAISWHDKLFGLAMGLHRSHSVLLIDPETLAITDRAPLPKGIRLVGSDEKRLVLHHKRANTLLVARSAALAPPLGSPLAAVEAEIDGIIKASRAAAKRKRA